MRLQLKSYCKRRLGTTFDLTRMAEDTFKSLSGNFTFNGIKNAIYIDGEYDPNKVGGFMNPKDDLQQYKFIVPGATKFAPLLTPVGCDPDNIMQLRYRVIKIVNCWIDGKSDGDCAASNFNKDLPKYEASKGKCEDDLTDQYPWGEFIRPNIRAYSILKTNFQPFQISRKAQPITSRPPPQRHRPLECLLQLSIFIHSLFQLLSVSFCFDFKHASSVSPFNKLYLLESFWVG